MLHLFFLTSAAPHILWKKLKMNLTGSNTGKLTMLKKYIKATGSLGRKKIIEIVQIGATMPNLVWKAYFDHLFP